MRRAAHLFALVGALVSSAAQSQEGGGISNPLWSTPLDSITAMRERPLFTKGRRPPPLAEAPRSADNALTIAPVAPPFSLIGTVVGGDERIAVMRENGSQTVLRLPLGASAQGWHVAEVAPRSVRLTRGPQSVILELPKPALR